MEFRSFQPMFGTPRAEAATPAERPSLFCTASLRTRQLSGHASNTYETAAGHLQDFRTGTQARLGMSAAQADRIGEEVRVFSISAFRRRQGTIDNDV